MRFPLCMFLILWLCCLSCSDDDPGNIIPDDENLSENFPDFSFLTTTPEGIQRYVFDVAEQTGSLINLSEQNEVDPIIARSYVAGRVVGLYVQDRVWLVNMETGSVVMGQNMFPLADEVISNWAVNTDETVYIGFHTDGTFEDFNGFAQNVVTLEQEQFPVGNIGQSVEPTFGLNHLVFHNNFGSGSGAVSTLGLINTQNNTALSPVLLPGDFVTGSIFDEQNDLYVFSTEGRYHRFNISDLSLIETISTDFRAVLNGREQLVDDMVYYTAQPALSELERLPAVFNLTTNEDTLVDLTISFQEISQARSYTDLQITDMQYSFAEEAWIVGYRFDTITNSGGGLFKVDLAGSILAEIQLDVIPETLVVFE